MKQLDSKTECVDSRHKVHRLQEGQEQLLLRQEAYDEPEKKNEIRGIIVSDL